MADLGKAGREIRGDVESDRYQVLKTLLTANDMLQITLLSHQLRKELLTSLMLSRYRRPRRHW